MIDGKTWDKTKAGDLERGHMSAATTPPTDGDQTHPGEGPAASVTLLGSLAAMRSTVEARIIQAARLVSMQVGQELLTDGSFSSVEELTPSQRRKWRAQVKALTVTELQYRLGMGMVEARELIGIANAPQHTRDLIIDALDSGHVSWPQVRAWFKRCARLDSDAALLVAQAMFGTDVTVAAKERLTPGGESIADHPWAQADYQRALNREAARVEGDDVEAERERRRRAYQQRDAHVTVHQDGSATMSITGDVISVTAAQHRLDSTARSIRKHGDERTLDQLRSDLARALLVHGTLPEPRTELEELQRSEQAERFTRIVNAQPAVTINLVTPWHSLTGSPACPQCSAPMSGGDPSAPRGVQSETPGVIPGAGTVAEIPGVTPIFLSPGHARELALTPGSRFYRFLTHPADGRLIERSQTAYRPDAAMRRQILAADLYSRAPGNLIPADKCELDHTIPWAPHDDCDTSQGEADHVQRDGNQEEQRTGLASVICPDSACHAGLTSELNLAALNQQTHHRKTDRHLVITMLNTRRDLRFTTLLNQSLTTRSHDYSQYQVPRRLKPEAIPTGVAELKATLQHYTIYPHDHDPGVQVDPADAHSHLTDDHDHANQALLAALCHREQHARLADADDYPGATEHHGPLAGWEWVAHAHRKQKRKQSRSPRPNAPDDPPNAPPPALPPPF